MVFIMDDRHLNIFASVLFIKRIFAGSCELADVF